MKSLESEYIGIYAFLVETWKVLTICKILTHKLFNFQSLYSEPWLIPLKKKVNVTSILLLHWTQFPCLVDSAKAFSPCCFLPVAPIPGSGFTEGRECRKHASLYVALPLGSQAGARTWYGGFWPRNRGRYLRLSVGCLLGGQASDSLGQGSANFESLGQMQPAASIW